MHCQHARVIRRAALFTSILAVTLLATAAMVPGSVLASPARSNLPALTVYRDPQLGFTIRLPAGWSAASTAGQQGATSAAGGTLANVRLDDGVDDNDFTLFLVVLESPDALALFTKQGTPTTHVGGYPAVAGETPPSSQFPWSCASRSFLAGNDNVLAQWCGTSAMAQQGVIEQALATYHPTGTANVPQTVASTRTASTAQPTPTLQSQPPQECSTLAAHAGIDLSKMPHGWGEEIATPTATASAPNSTWQPTPGWASLAPGVAICGNGNPVPYRGAATAYFQCVELINRFLTERWGLGPWYLAGSAGAFLDYYTGADDQHLSPIHRGSADDKPDIQIVPDARWGVNGAAPQPGDILVWQDVANPSTWRSVTTGPGHVAIVTAVDAQYVYVAQQNAMWSKGCGQSGAPCSNAFMAYPLERNPNGQGWSVDIGNLNGIKGRIIRGWLHFVENSGPVTAPPTREDVYAIGANGHLYAYHDPNIYATSGTPAWSIEDLSTAAGLVPSTTSAAGVSSKPTSDLPAFAGIPSSSVSTDGRSTIRRVDAITTQGHLYEFENTGTSWHATDLSALTGGILFTGSPSAVNYTDPSTNSTHPGAAHHDIFAVSHGGDLYTMTWTASSGWQVRDISLDATDATTGGYLPPTVSFAANSAAHPVGPSASVGHGDAKSNALTEYADVVGNDGHLYAFAHTPGCSAPTCTAWTFTDVTHSIATPSANLAVTLVGIPSSTEIGNTSRVAAVGANGQLYCFTDDPQHGWTVARVTTTATAQTAFRDSPTTSMVVEGNTQLLLIYATSADGSIYAFSTGIGSTAHWSSRAIHSATPTFSAASGPSVRPSALAADPTSAQQVMYVISSDGHLYSEVSKDGATWSLITVSGTTGIGRLNGDGVSEILW